MAAFRLSARKEYTSLLEKYDTWMFDCDGVLWNGDCLIDGAAQVLQLLRRANKKLIFVTNNSMKSRRSHQEKFALMGVEVHLDEIYGAAYVTAVYISTIIKLPKTKKVYLIGREGLEEELAQEGISFVGGTDPADTIAGPSSLATFTPDPSVAAVVCGFDLDITYTKLSKAFRYLSSPDCHFIAPNLDKTRYPTPHGKLPAAGALVAALHYALGREPVCTGKPALMALECVKAKVQFDPTRTITIGDQLDTDILFGKGCGLATLLVLTGITTDSDITGIAASPVLPDYVTNSIADFQGVLSESKD